MNSIACYREPLNLGHIKNRIKIDTHMLKKADPTDVYRRELLTKRIERHRQLIVETIMSCENDSVLNSFLISPEHKHLAAR